MKRLALFTVLSEKLRDGEIFFVDAFRLPEPKTKEFAKIMKNLSPSSSSVGLVSPDDKNIERASRNIRGLGVFRAANLNAIDLLSKKYILFPQSALEIVGKTFLKRKQAAAAR